MVLLRHQCLGKTRDHRGACGVAKPLTAHLVITTELFESERSSRRMSKGAFVSGS